jgi:hypothetical protein
MKMQRTLFFQLTCTCSFRKSLAAFIPQEVDEQQNNLILPFLHPRLTMNLQDHYYLLPHKKISALTFGTKFVN